VISPQNDWKAPLETAGLFAFGAKQPEQTRASGQVDPRHGPGNGITSRMKLSNKEGDT
jgi:hypothetical protein